MNFIGSPRIDPVLPTAAKHWGLACVVVFLLLATQNAIGQTSGSKLVQRTDRFPLSTKATTDQQFLQGLRDRRLFQLAMEYSDQQLADTTISAIHRATLAIEQIKTLTTQAVYSPASDRRRYFDAIDALVDRIRKSSGVGQGGPPRIFLMEVQRALAHMSHASLLSQELAAELIPASESEKALAELRTSRKILDETQRAIKRVVPERAQPKVAGQLNAEQLLALSSNIQFQLAKCNLIRAELYRDDQAGQLGKVDALNQVQGQLSEVIRSVATGEPLWWETRVARVKCLRLLDRIEDANRLLAQSTSMELPSEVAPQLLEEKLLLAIESRDRKAMEQLLMAASMPGFPTTATLDLAVLKTTLELALRSDLADQKQLWMNEATRRTKQIESRYGDYWGRRAELVLVGSVGETSSVTGTPAIQPAGMSEEVELLTRVGNEAFRKKRFRDALNAYDSAIKKATEQGNTSVICTLEVQAGQCLESEGNHRDAGRRMVDAASRFSRNPVAPAAHLRGCWNLAQVVNAQASTELQASANQAFVEALRQHLKIWPQGSTSGQAAVWLGSSLSRSRQYQASLTAYLQVPTTDTKFFETATLRAAAAARFYLDSLPESDRDQATQQIEAQLQSKLSGLNPSSQQSILLRLLQQHLELLYEGQMEVDQSWIENVSVNESAHELLQPIRLFYRLIQTKNRTGKMEPSEMLKQVGSLQVLDTLDRYIKAEAGRSPGRADQMVVLRESVASRALELAGDNVTLATQWRLKKVDAMTLAGQFDGAISELKVLERLFPKKADIKMQMARVLTQAHGSTDPAKPLKQWRSIAVRLKPGSDNWWEAKVNVVTLLRRSGDKAAAKKLVRYLEISPGWAGTKFEKDLNALKQALR